MIFDYWYHGQVGGRSTYVDLVNGSIQGVAKVCAAF